MFPLGTPTLASLEGFGGALKPPDSFPVEGCHFKRSPHFTVSWANISENLPHDLWKEKEQEEDNVTPILFSGCSENSENPSRQIAGRRCVVRNRIRNTPIQVSSSF